MVQKDPLLIYEIDILLWCLGERLVVTPYPVSRKESTISPETEYFVCTFCRLKKKSSGKETLFLMSAFRLRR